MVYGVFYWLLLLNNFIEEVLEPYSGKGSGPGNSRLQQSRARCRRNEKQKVKECVWVGKSCLALECGDHMDVTC